MPVAAGRTDQNTDEQDAHDQPRTPTLSPTRRIVLGGLPPPAGCVQCRRFPLRHVRWSGCASSPQAPAHACRRAAASAATRVHAAYRRTGRWRAGCRWRHPAPHAVVFAPYVADEGVHDERGKLTAQTMSSLRPERSLEFRRVRALRGTRALRRRRRRPPGRAGCAR